MKLFAVFLVFTVLAAISLALPHPQDDHSNDCDHCVNGPMDIKPFYAQNGICRREFYNLCDMVETNCLILKDENHFTKEDETSANESLPLCDLDFELILKAVFGGFDQKE